MEKVWKRWRGEIFRAVLVFADLAALSGSFVGAYWLRYRAPGIGAIGTGPGFAHYWGALLIACFIWVWVLSYFGLYQLRRGWRLSDLALTSVSAVSVAFAAFLAISYMLHLVAYSRLLVAYVWGVNTVCVVAIRVATKIGLMWLSQAGVGVRKLAVLGDNASARILVKTISLHPELGYEVVGMLRPERANGSPADSVFRGVDHAARSLLTLGVDDLVVALPLGRNEEIRELVWRCQEAGIKVRILPDIYETYSSSMPCEPIENIPLFVPRDKSLADWELAVKRLFDLFWGCALLLLTAAIGAAIWVRQRVCGGACVIEREERIGQGGRPFTLYRFTIPRRADGSSSKFGRWLMRYSLSELPQSWNVIRGEMSLVGPRPEGPERVARYSHWNRRRLLLKPGITGLAQVNGLRGFASTDEKMRFDLEYVERQSPMLDFLILLQTIWTVAKRGETDLGEAQEVEGGALANLHREAAEVEAAAVERAAGGSGLC